MDQNAVEIDGVAGMREDVDLTEISIYSSLPEDSTHPEYSRLQAYPRILDIPISGYKPRLLLEGHGFCRPTELEGWLSEPKKNAKEISSLKLHSRNLDMQ